MHKPHFALFDPGQDGVQYAPVEQVHTRMQVHVHGRTHVEFLFAQGPRQIAVTREEFEGKSPSGQRSTHQAVIALSSGETQYHAGLKGATVSMGFQSMALDLGVKLKVVLYTDSTAAT